jgi:hypothetical protein
MIDCKDYYSKNVFDFIAFINENRSALVQTGTHMLNTPPTAGRATGWPHSYS